MQYAVWHLDSNAYMASQKKAIRFSRNYKCNSHKAINTHDKLQRRMPYMSISIQLCSLRRNSLDPRFCYVILWYFLGYYSQNFWIAHCST